MAKTHYALQPFEAQDLLNIDDLLRAADKFVQVYTDRVEEIDHPVFRIGDEDVKATFKCKDGRSYSLEIRRA